MACFELVAAFLAVHFDSAEVGFVLADRLVAAVEVYTAAEEPAAGVALAGSEQSVCSGVVPDAVLFVVACSVCCLVQRALGNP